MLVSHACCASRASLAPHFFQAPVQVLFIKALDPEMHINILLGKQKYDGN